MELDPSILAALPTQAKVLLICLHGETNWSTGLRVDVDVLGDEKSYFLKIIDRADYVGMAEAEYEGQSAIAMVIPENSVRPTSWGYFKNDHSKAWFLSPFRNLRRPDPQNSRDDDYKVRVLAAVEALHRQSKSPNGKFGFHVTPYYGPPPMNSEWSESWEEFWTREFRSGLDYAERMLGYDSELLQIAEPFIEKVIPRLLRPLQTGGRSIKPSLCHGDLWDGNVLIDGETGNPMLFDPCPFYGHHEIDLQSMRDPRYIIGSDFVKLYYERGGASKPVQDFDDRNALYAM